MKIESIDTWILRIPFLRTTADVDGAHHELIGVTVHAEGATGMGFSLLTDHAAGGTVKALLDDLLVPRVLGRDALQAERIWHDLEQLTHRMGTGINRFAMASLDIALWDLRAKVHGHSLAREIGQIADEVPVYGSGKAGTRLGIDELVELSAEYVAAGFDSVKIRVGMDPREDPTRIAAVREAVGEQTGIMIDANERLSLPTALALGRRLAEYGITWFEEPVNYLDRQAHVRLGQQLPIPVAGGEHHCSAAAFTDYITSGAFDIVQPNVCMVGGITETIRIMRMAEMHGVGFAPHLMTDFNVHLAAATTSTMYVEYFPFLEPYTSNRLTIVDGRAKVPEGPGHGMVFTEETFTRYQVA